MYSLPLAGQLSILKKLGKSGRWSSNIERDLHRKVGLHVPLTQSLFWLNC